MGVPGAVALEGGAVAVMAKAVGFDDQASIAPEEVHLVGTHARIQLWLGKVVAATEREEDALKLAASEVVLRSELSRRNQAEVECAADGGAVGLIRDGAVQVLKRAGGLGEPDAVAEERNTSNEGGGAVNFDAVALLPAAVTRNRDLDWPVMWRKHQPECGCAAVADRSALTQGENSGHASAFDAEMGMADRVYTAMNAVNPAGRDTSPNALVVDPC
jgi:hypothetical protein